MILCSYSEKLYSEDEIAFNEIDKQSFINEIKMHLKELNKITENSNTLDSFNVIYVLSNPQPGQVRGDWSVIKNGKIYSNHRTKIRAIEQARKIARKHNSTIKVQNIDGLFKESFKPRKK
jgi:hypothetical protein